MTEDEEEDFGKWEEEYWSDHWMHGESGPEVVAVALILIVLVAAFGAWCLS